MNKRLLSVFALLIGFGVLFWFFPLFHIVSLHQVAKQQQNAVFDANVLAREFWKIKLLPAVDHATPISDLWKALAADPVAARKKFGHSPGMSSVTYFLIQGSGKITKAEKDAVQLAPDGANPEIVKLSTGLVFGNAVRDCTGLMNGSDFPNSQDFNDLSTALNHIVETEVIPALREKAAPGKMLRFAGCLEIEEGETPKIPRIVPIRIEIE
jgi:predicted lipoprotein